MKTRTNLLAIGMLLAVSLSAHAQPVPISTVQFTSARYTVDENAGSVTLVVERIGGPGATAYVEYAIRDGSATREADYVAQTGFLDFNGETNLPIVIPIVNDAVAEKDETFFITLFNADSISTELGVLTTTVVTILQNDRDVEFGSGICMVDEGTGMAVITVMRVSVSTHGFRVDYFTDSCDATAGVDYIPQSGTLNFAPGEKEKTIAIPILDDALVEGDEAVNVTLTNPIGAVLGILSGASLVIQDNDKPSPANVDRDFQRKGLWSAPPDSGWDAASGPKDVAVSGHYVVVANGSAGLWIFDVSNPANPQLVSRFETVSWMMSVTIACDQAFVREGGDLAVFDISQPSNPQRAGTYHGFGFSGTVAVQGNRAYLHSSPLYEGGGAALEVVDINDPANPLQLGRIFFDGWQTDMAVSGRYAYLAAPCHGLTVIDISDPLDPREAGATMGSFGQCVRNVAISGHYVYATGEHAQSSALWVFDLVNPAFPQQVGVYYDFPESWSYFVNLKVVEGFAFVTSSDALEVIDMRDPAHPRRAGFYATGGGPAAVSGHYAYLANGNGLEVIDLSVPANPQRVGGDDTSDIHKDVAVAGNLACVANYFVGLDVLDISDPASPELIGTYPSRFINDVEVSGDYAYVTSGRLEIIDIRDPSDPRRAGDYSTTGSVYRVAVSGIYAYLAVVADSLGKGGGLEVLDIRNPSDPHKVGAYSNYGASMLIVTVSGDYAYVTYSAGGLMEVIDIRDPANPRRVGDYNSTGFAYRVAVSGNYACLADRQLGLWVIDIRDPTQPKPAGYAQTSGTAQDVAVSGQYAYVACAEGGLEVFDIGDPTNPRRVGRNASFQASTVTVAGDRVFTTSDADGLVILQPFRELRFEGVSARAAVGTLLSIAGPPGLTGQVQRGTDLRDWEDWTRVTFRDGPGYLQEVVDPDSSPNSRRFYRVTLSVTP